MFKIKCTSCREEHPNWVGIDATVRQPCSFLPGNDLLTMADSQETRDISGSRGEAHLVWRCQMCKREHTVSASRILSTVLLHSSFVLTFI